MSTLNLATYNRALVSYIDILGFRELVDLSRKDPLEVQKIDQLLETMRNELSTGGRVHRRTDGRKERIFSSFTFSDLIVRTTRIPGGEDLAEFVEWELVYLAAKQLQLALQGVWVRGGLCVGDIYAEPRESVVFGPALVKSYTLESKYAIYPRIIIDRDLIFRENQNISTAGFADYIRRGEDGAHFLDYLFGHSLTGFDFPEPLGPDSEANLLGHRKMILKEISGDIQKKDEHVKQKYIWLALYHNATIERLRAKPEVSFSATIEELKIPESMLSF